MRFSPSIVGFAWAALVLAGCSSPPAPPEAAQPPLEQQTVAPVLPAGPQVVPTEPDYLPPVVDTQGKNPLDMPGKKSAAYTNPFPEGSYEHFAAQKAYPATAEIYCDERLLSQTMATNSKIIICLPQQRARLYVYGRVALDWPVSTGVDGHETPTGAFRVMEKSRQHYSSRYGKWVNDKGRVLDSNADLTREAPTGATFRPSSMPCWHRLTWDGVGIHGGRVVPGRRLSHGCIRSPYNAVRKLFEYSVLGMPVYVSRAIEDYQKGGSVRPIDVKYRPGNSDYTDLPPEKKKAQATAVA